MNLVRKKYAVLFFILLGGCENIFDSQSNTIRTSYGESRITKEVYNKKHHLVLKQYFTKDTVPNGIRIEYFSSGKLCNIRWFDSSQKEPICGVFYTEHGVFDTLKGSPFLDEWYNTQIEPCFKIINPPNVKYIIRFTDSDYVNDKIIKQSDFLTQDNDSTTIFRFNKKRFERFEGGHNYYISFCIIDTSKRRIAYMYSKKISQLPSISK
jgi:hypothetical protein